MKIGYVCTNFRNAAYSVGAVQSLFRNKGHEIYAVVVDNCSGGDDLQTLRSIATPRPDQIRIIDSSENLGYFGGLNLGIGKLLSSFGDFDAVVVGNNDLVFPPDFSDRLRICGSVISCNPVVSPDVVTIDGFHQNPHVIDGISTVRKQLYDIFYTNYTVARILGFVARLLRPLSQRGDENQWQVAQHISQGHGSCYILTPLFFSEFVRLWAPGFMMGEEAFLERQLDAKGFKVYYEPRIVVNHHCHMSVNLVPRRLMWEYAKRSHQILKATYKAS